MLLVHFDPIAVPQLDLDLALQVAAAVVAAATVLEDSSDSSLLPFASSAYSLLTEIQEAEHKDLSLLHSLQVEVAVLESDNRKYRLLKQNQKQDQKLESHRLQSLLVDQSKEVPVDSEFFLKFIGGIWTPPELEGGVPAQKP